SGFYYDLLSLPTRPSSALVLQALRADHAARADLLGPARGPALLRDEGLRVRLGAERPLLPTHERVVDRLAEERQHRCHALHLSRSEEHTSELQSRENLV